MTRIIEIILGLLDEFIVITLIIVSILVAIYYSGSISFLTFSISIFVYVIVIAILGYRIVKSQIEKPKVGPEALLGAVGDVVEDICYEGLVKMNGELWKAKTYNSCITRGNKVIVTEINGLTLIVKKYKEEKITQ